LLNRWLETESENDEDDIAIYEMSLQGIDVETQGWPRGSQQCDLAKSGA
jgi:hypothetical protein